MPDLSMVSAADLAAGFRSGVYDPVDALDAALAAVAAHDKHVNAIVFLDEAAARHTAEESARWWKSGQPHSPVDGVPVSIKDLLPAKGWPTLKASTLVDPQGPWDEGAPAVARLRESGAVIFGKNATPEFGWKGVTDSLRRGATGNPWDPSKTAGGSSGGAAAATALGMGTRTGSALPRESVRHARAPRSDDEVSHRRRAAHGCADPVRLGPATSRIVDLAIFYGRNNLLINGGQGYVPGNVFGEITEGYDEIVAACQDVWMGGARGETLTFARRDVRTAGDPAR